MPRSGGTPNAARAYVALVALLLIIMLLLAPAARGEEVFTSQAAAARATESTWIPAPSPRAALCIVDTGNDVNPDTSNVIARFAVDNGTTADLHPDHHGTLMSMIASAPHNGWGMVGVAPSINIVSVRASRDGRTFGSTDLRNGILLCISKAEKYNIKAISLSLGGPVSSGLDLASMSATQDAVDNARRAGLSVVAAAGNRPGAVDWPAAYAPVLAVAASDSLGRRCQFAAAGPEVDVWAPGCPQDVTLSGGQPAWASGSSEAAALVAAIITQLRGLLPALSTAEVEQMVTAQARGTAGELQVDADALFRAAGLADHLHQGRGAMPSQPPVASTESLTSRPVTAARPPGVGAAVPGHSAPLGTVPLDDRARRRLLSPRARVVRFRHQLLTLHLANKPASAQVIVRVYARKRGRSFPTLIRTLKSTSDRVRTRVLGIVSQVSMIYIDPSGERYPSASVSVRPRR